MSKWKDFTVSLSCLHQVHVMRSFCGLQRYKVYFRGNSPVVGASLVLTVHPKSKIGIVSDSLRCQIVARDEP